MEDLCAWILNVQAGRMLACSAARASNPLVSSLNADQVQQQDAGRQAVRDLEITHAVALSCKSSPRFAASVNADQVKLPGDPKLKLATVLLCLAPALQATFVLLVT
jgi:hypothetical protein